MSRTHSHFCRGLFAGLIMISVLFGCGGGGGGDGAAPSVPPTAAKAFTTAAIPPGGTSVLTITLGNSNAVPVNGVTFVDAYPSNIVNAATPNGTTTCTGGTVTAAAGGGSVSLAGGTIPAGGSCAVTVTVTGTVPGTYNNTIPIGGITTANAGANTAAAAATLTVGGFAPPTATKAFSTGTISAGGTSTITITLSNSNAVPVTGAAFTDQYPSNVVNAAAPNGTTTCIGGVVTAAAGGGSVALAGGTIPAGGSCAVTVRVTSSVPGTYNNSIPAGGITTANAGANTAAATGTLTVSPLAPPPQLSLSGFASGLVRPVDLQAPSDNSGRLFVVEQGGTIRIIRNGALVPQPFLDITGRVFSPAGSEEGLLGLAFHPDYPVNGRFFVNYVRTGGPTNRQSVIAEYVVSSNPDVAAPASERILLTVDQPFDNHKAGQLAFGNDRMLYISFGDGGSGGDPFGNGQNTGTLLGKMLRIDVDSSPSQGKAYAVPPDNPFAGGGGLPEIWAYGLRNPWRFSFDRASGRLFCADVGQNRLEEVNLIVRGGNFGWNIMEGDACFSPAAGCNTTGLALPITQYSHAEGSAVIGGYVYLGSAIPGLAGTYVFGDLSGGKVWGLQQDPTGNWQRTQLLSHARIVSSFGQDQAGELYLLDYSNGLVLRITAL